MSPRIHFKFINKWEVKLCSTNTAIMRSVSRVDHKLVTIVTQGYEGRVTMNERGTTRLSDICLLHIERLGGIIQSKLPSREVTKKANTINKTASPRPQSPTRRGASPTRRTTSPSPTRSSSPRRTVSPTRIKSSNDKLSTLAAGVQDLLNKSNIRNEIAVIQYIRDVKWNKTNEFVCLLEDDVIPIKLGESTTISQFLNDYSIANISDIANDLPGGDCIFPMENSFMLIGYSRISPAASHSQPSAPVPPSSLPSSNPIIPNSNNSKILNPSNYSNISIPNLTPINSSPLLGPSTSNLFPSGGNFTSFSLQNPPLPSTPFLPSNTSSNASFIQSNEPLVQSKSPLLSSSYINRSSYVFHPQSSTDPSLDAKLNENNPSSVPVVPSIQRMNFNSTTVPELPSTAPSFPFQSSSRSSVELEHSISFLQQLPPPHSGNQPPHSINPLESGAPANLFPFRSNIIPPISSHPSQNVHITKIREYPPSFPPNEPPVMLNHVHSLFSPPLASQPASLPAVEEKIDIEKAGSRSSQTSIIHAPVPNAIQFQASAQVDTLKQASEDVSIKY